MFGRPGKLNENIINCMTFRQNDQHAIIIFISMVYVDCGSGFTNVFIGAIPETKNLTLKINLLSILRLQVQYMI